MISLILSLVLNLLQEAMVEVKKLVVMEEVIMVEEEANILEEARCLPLSIMASMEKMIIISNSATKTRNKKPNTIKIKVMVISS